MFLIIDTSKKLYLALSKNDQIIGQFKGEFLKQSEKLLLTFDKLLSKNKVKLKDLKAIFVNVGPGSFTGLRVGIDSANALAFSLNIPLVGIKEKEMNNESLAETGFIKFQKGKISKMLLPIYAQKPHITKVRKRKTSPI